MREEQARVNHYLDPSTDLKIKEVAERELISVHMKSLLEVRSYVFVAPHIYFISNSQMENSGLISMLRDDKIEDLKRMYSLFARVQNGLAMMRDMMSNDVKEIGKSIVTDEEKVMAQLTIGTRR